MKQNKQKRNENTRQKNKQTQENVKYKEKKTDSFETRNKRKTQKNNFFSPTNIAFRTEHDPVTRQPDQFQ